MYCSDQSLRNSQSRKMLRRAACAAGVAVVNLGILGGGVVGNLGGVCFPLPGVAVCEAQFSVYEAYVGVDVGDMLEQDLSITIAGGEVNDINDEGYAVGSYFVSGGVKQPFFFSPVDGGGFETVSLSIGTVNYGGAIFNALTTFDTGASQTWKDIVIAGTLLAPSDGGPSNETAFWIWNNTASQWEPTLVFSGNRLLSHGNDISNGGSITGDVSQSGVVNAFIKHGNGTVEILSNLGTNTSGWGYGINLLDEVAGKQDDPNLINSLVSFAFIDQPSGSNRIRTIVNPDPNGSSVAYEINDSGHVVGSSTPNSGHQTPALWWNTGNSTWTHLDITGLPTGGTIYNEIATDINDQNEVVGWYNITTSGRGAFYVQLASNAPSGGNITVNLNDDGGGRSLILYPRALRSTGGNFEKALCINDNGGIGGSVKPDSANSNTRPTLLVPQDVNNNQVPDIREILQARINNSGELDVNNNWILDWGENDLGNTVHNMRVGLHAPGNDGSVTKADQILNNQIVRQTGITLDRINQLTTSPTLDPENISIMDLGYDVDANCFQSTVDTCKTLLGYMEAWTGANGPKQRELIFTIRNPDPDVQNLGNFDEFEPVGSQKRADWLDGIRRFAYRWARCADYAQFGNEIYTGAGEYYFEAGDLASGYTGEMSEIRIKSELKQATADVVEWLAEQAESARIGSALAGRPWRIIGPGVGIGNVSFGATGNAAQVDNMPANRWVGSPDAMAFALRELNIMLNDNRMYFDMHMHYTKVSDATKGLDDLQDTTKGGWGLNVPDSVMILEFGPKGDTTKQWWTDNVNQFQKYYSPLGDDPDHLWDDFIKEDSQSYKGWEVSQYGSVGDFSMASLLSQINNHQYAVVCYGPTLQGDNLDDVFAIAALRASKLGSKFYINDQLNFFSPIEGDYENAASTHQILVDFTPHADQCDPNVVCPPCSSQ